MFQIDPLSKIPIYEQIIDQLERFVISGALRAGDPLPSVRSLSVQLKANPNTIQKAYAELDSRGIIRSVPGKGCFVCERAAEILKDREKNRLEELTRLCAELKTAGVSEKEMIGAVKKAFGKKEEE